MQICKRCPIDVFGIDKNKLDMNFSEESSPWMCSLKNMFLKISQNVRENTCPRAFLNKVDNKPFDNYKLKVFNKLYLKRGSGTGVFL